ncbi:MULTISPECIES: hypothetical protein [Nostoc]|uniref:Uncharacterized protein n=3 Tax=Nostoc TaxID=1177 RepID=A0ABR8I9B3_9NOSO|nr:MULTISPECIES: hypothetical protein [Nostoc]MBD2560671.1 hypothetical protein [Nostoc linckia FACHB-391]MBD2648232.1 hypothetical protein [Nostoc foliaceum FACHB-393]
MPNWSAIEASFLRQSHAQQLGELAASLARLNSWSQKSAIRELVPILLSESLLYVSLIQQKSEINNVELNQLQDLLQNWINVWDKSMEITDIASVASTWSQRVLEMSGLLASESVSA